MGEISFAEQEERVKEKRSQGLRNPLHVRCGRRKMTGKGQWAGGTHTDAQSCLGSLTPYLFALPN